MGFPFKRKSCLCFRPTEISQLYDFNTAVLQLWDLRSTKGHKAYLTWVFLLKVRPVGYDGNNPTSVAEWLESLELGDYTKSFLINGYTSMELVKKIWEIELINVSPLSSFLPPLCDTRVK